MKQVIIAILLFFTIAQPAAAIYDPREVQNNRFGIHIIDENDLSDASRLVNSNGGDWGYVALVIREDDRQVQKWQSVFNRMRKLRLIPIIRLATKVEHGGWVKPRVEDIDSWVEFLNSLNWVVENRYVVVFNEPNHAKEWGGEINPEEYGWYLREFSRRLKARSPDFFILPAGLDTSADDNNGTLDELTFLKRMVAKESDVFSFIDGWTSHSYPQPDFSGSPSGLGRGTVRTYQWELDQLARFGVKRLPVFITETGWQHNSGKSTDFQVLTPDMVAGNYHLAYQNAWNSQDVVAVTPFLLNYQDEPFANFSWKKHQSNEFFSIFDQVQSLEKTTGEPKQHESATIIRTDYPEKLVIGSDYTLFLEFENTGQSLISKETGWHLELEGLPAAFEILVDNLNEVEPFQRTRIKVLIKTPLTAENYPYSILLKKGSTTITRAEAQVTLIPPPSLFISAKLWIDRLATGSDYHLYIFNESNDFVQAVGNFEFKDGFSDVENLFNIIPNRNYHLILIKPYYLPRQVRVPISESKTAVSFPVLLPFDPSSDGVFSFSDVRALLNRPLETIKLLIPL